LTHFLDISQRYYKMLGPTIRIKRKNEIPYCYDHSLHFLQNKYVDTYYKIGNVRRT
jgi:hypothetical protein